MEKSPLVVLHLDGQALQLNKILLKGPQRELQHPKELQTTGTRGDPKQKINRTYPRQHRETTSLNDDHPLTNQGRSR
jgi:hypothetical protein